MTILYINTGTSPNAGDGDSLRTAFFKINENFRTVASSVVSTSTSGTADTGHISFSANIISSTGTNENIILNPNGIGKVEFRDTAIAFNNSSGGNIGQQAHILYTKQSGNKVGLGIDLTNSSLRIVGDKDNLGTLVDMGLYTGLSGAWASKVYIDYQGNVVTQGSLTAKNSINVQGTIEASDIITAAAGVQFPDGFVQVRGIINYVSSIHGIDYIEVTTSTGDVLISNMGVRTLSAGTGTQVSSNTGTVTVWSSQNLQQVTANGATTNKQISISNSTTATSTATGALTIAGGVGIGGDLHLGGGLYSNSITILQTSITSNTNSTSTTTGALTVNGGVGIGLNLHVGGDISLDSQGAGIRFPNGTTQYTAGLTESALNLGDFVVVDNQLLPISEDLNVIISNRDKTSGTSHISYIDIPSANTYPNGILKINSQNGLVITTDADSTDGIVITTNQDGFGQGYIAIGNGGTENTAGTYFYSSQAAVYCYPNDVIPALIAGDLDAGTLELRTFNDTNIMLRPSGAGKIVNFAPVLHKNKQILSTVDAGIGVGGVNYSNYTTDASPLDLSKQVQKLTSDSYYLADGMEGQIIQLVMTNGATPNTINVFCDNGRVDGSNFSPIFLTPFDSTNPDIITMLFTDGAWQSSAGTWD